MSKELTFRQVAKMIKENPECLDQPFRIVIWNDDVLTLDPEWTEFETTQGYLGGHPDFPVSVDGEEDNALNGPDWAFHI